LRVGRKFTFEEVKIKFEELGCKLLSDVYEGKDVPMEFICECGNKSTISWNNLRRGCRCKEYCGINKRTKARNTLEITQKIKQTYFRKRKEYYRKFGCEYLEDEIKTNHDVLKYKCACGKIHFKTFGAFKNCWKCDDCMDSDKVARSERRKLSFPEVNFLVESKQCELLSESYGGYYDELQFMCSCGNKFHKTFAAFKLSSECSNCYSKKRCGENNWRWNPGLTEEERERNKSRASFPDQKEWKKKVYKRDGYSCVVCGSSKSNTLRAHHLDGYNWCVEKRTDVSNGVTLCEQHHSEFHSVYGYGDNTREQFDEWYENKRNTRKDKDAS
jgi:hypothetical protein